MFRVIIRVIKSVVMVFCGVVISSCSILSPVQVGSATTYIVNTVPLLPVTHTHRHPSLLVMLPIAPPMYSTTDMVYTTRQYQQDFFAKNSWIESPAQMLQPLIVQALQNTHAFAVVNASSMTGSVDYVVHTEILQFEQDFKAAQSVFRLVLRIQLVNAINHQTMATKEIAVIEPAPQNTPYGGVIAANRATAKALVALTQFVATSSDNL